MQVIIDADTNLVLAAARPAPGTKVGAKAWRDSVPATACEDMTVLGNGAYINTGLEVPHRKRPGRALRAANESGCTPSQHGRLTNGARPQHN
ncbi:hypothetical protein [Kitasatospora paranensis]|uniref:Transposase n=1 Tax=Kitasatospora paranensis TaxID=258053 RepID=A0ABW2FX33_9ACTN